MIRFWLPVGMNDSILAEAICLKERDLFYESLLRMMKDQSKACLLVVLYLYSQ
jgi:hypothetical protein